MGKLIVIDGLDGSGKETQTKRLSSRLTAEGWSVRSVHFPDYNQPSSILVQRYLQGDFGQAKDVNAYAASSFYAVDRYASFRRFWQKDYEKGTLILADRYVTSNLIHQMVKLPKVQWPAFRQWLEDYEYSRLGLPRPDAVLYLDVEPAVSQALLQQRYAQTNTLPDIHEQDSPYMQSCRTCAQYAAQACGWHWINCSEKSSILPIESIAEIVYTKVNAILREN